MPSDDETRNVLRSARTVAVVGLSDRAERDSNVVARYLLGQGYTIVPVNPNVASVFGRPAYPSLTAVPESIRIDIVDVFRRSDQVGPIVAEAIARGAPTLWMQLGVRDDQAAQVAQAHGLRVYQDLCIMVEHRRLRVGPVAPPGSGGPSQIS